MNLLALSKVQAGFPSPADDYLEMPLSLDKWLVNHPAATFFVRVAGISLSNLGIYEGDIAMVDRSLKPKHHDIVVAVINNEFLIKELHCHKNNLLLRAHHAEFPNLILDEENGDYIWGVVATIIRRFT